MEQEDGLIHGNILSLAELNEEDRASVAVCLSTPFVGTLSTAIPPEILERQRQQQKEHDEALSGPMQATVELRWAVPELAHIPSDVKLQQCFKGVTYGGWRRLEWRDVPRVVVKKGKEHE